MNKIETVSRNKFKILDSVTTESGVKMPRIQGQLSEVEVVSGNGYRYKKDFWETVLKNPAIKQQIKNHDMLGTIEHPVDDEAYLKTPYADVSHVVLDVWLENGVPYGIFGLANNPNGNAIKALLDLGHCPGVSTRGLGDFSSDEVSKYVNSDNYALITWDIVRNPNFNDLHMEKLSDSLKASPLYKEVLDMYQLRDSSYDNFDKEKLKKDLSQVVSELSSLINKF